MLRFRYISILAYVLTKIISGTAFKYLKCAVSNTAICMLIPKL